MTGITVNDVDRDKVCRGYYPVSLEVRQDNRTMSYALVMFFLYHQSLSVVGNIIRIYGSRNDVMSFHFCRAEENVAQKASRSQVDEPGPARFEPYRGPDRDEAASHLSHGSGHECQSNCAKDTFDKLKRS